MNSTCKLIKELRMETGLKASQFADVMGVNKSSVSKWENDEVPSVEMLYRIARYFRITVDELIKGKLNNSSSIDKFVIDYSLEEYDIPQLIDERNIALLVEYYKKCQKIKKKFLSSLRKAAYQGLSDIDLKEFNYLSEYVYVNPDIIKYKVDYNARYNKLLDPNEMAAVKDYFDRIDKHHKDEKDWELDNLCCYRFKLFETEIVEAQLFEPFVEMYKLLDQYGKNAILNNTISRLPPIYSIRNRYVLAMILDGGMVLKNGYTHSTLWDEEVIDAYEGELRIVDMDKSGLAQDNQYFRFEGNCPYQEYASVIDKEKTSLLKEASLLRKNKPIEYYKRLKSGEFDKLLDC
ncbi:MAG: helix-turn-helix transcriptional regulator [Erysipelotrichaceae bacterium]|nr:helix-turn-helix transcriptional regulator [Erysipelotrichaceae bacterium]